MFIELVKFKVVSETIDSIPEKLNFSERSNTSGNMFFSFGN